MEKKSALRRKLSYEYGKVFWVFLSSYLGIILLLLGLLGFVGMQYMVRNFEKEEIRITQNKLKVIVEDFETQAETMLGIALNVASMQEFDSKYFTADKYREIQMGEMLADYAQFSDVYDQFFLKYAGRSTIYISNGSTALDKVFLKALAKEEYDSLADRLEQLSMDGGDGVVLYPLKDQVLFIYPQQKYSYSNSGRKSVLCFVVSRTKLELRMKKLVGKLDGNWEMYYFGKSLFEQLSPREEGFNEAVSGQGRYVIHYWPDEESSLTWSDVMGERERLIFLIVVLVVVTAGFGAAYRNYLPLHRLINKYSTAIDVNVSSDWESVELLLKTLLTGREQDGQRIRKQHRLFQEKIVRIIVAGKYSDTVREFMLLLNMKLEGNHFGIIRCDCREADPVVIAGIQEEIEVLSCEDATLYTCWDIASDATKENMQQSTSLYVLIAAEEKYLLEEYREMVQELVSIRDDSGSAELICSSNTLQELTPDRAQMITQKDAGEESYKQSRKAQLALDYIKEHYKDFDMSLDKMAEDLQVTRAYLSRIIKESFHNNYKDYLTQLRITEAKRLLLETDESVVNICSQIGYNHVSYFIRTFQKHEGMTPAKFREVNHADR